MKARLTNSSLGAALAILILLGVVAMGVIGASVPAASSSEIVRTDLQRHDLSTPGREVVQVRVDFGPGVSAPRHSHPGEEIVYAIEGQLEYQVEGQPPQTLSPGDVLFIPSGAIHEVRNVGSGPAAELATYIVEKGKPLVVPDK